ncbi:APC family permease [Kocuria sp. TGY1127_2]|uniref:APC family permease n=1 Tax=Kocuria sp. TGY1127_2 TaxID=2711328 RepID=UPI0015B8C484|nr:APC family permease [Kocuria sp. TGY1127_2]
MTKHPQDGPGAARSAAARVPSSDPATRSLKRNVTGFLLYVFILGDVLGAGIYALVGQIAGEVGGVTWIPMTVALLLALLTAASYAELVTKYPRAGGSAVFAERAFNSPLVSYLVGFAMLAAGVVSAAALALAFAGDYLGSFVHINPVLGAIIFLCLVAALNMRGIKESLRSNVIMTMIEFSGLLVVIICVGVLVANHGGDLTRATSFANDVQPIPAVLGAAILSYYSFVGFETSANIIEEVRHPSKVYPRALFGALITAGVMYALVGTAASVAVDSNTLAQSSGPLSTVMGATGVPIPAWIFSLIALVAVANGSLLTMIMASRLAYGMARQGILPSPLARVLPRRRTPWIAILVTTVCAIGLTVAGSVAVLAETVVILLLLVFLSTNVAVLVLRREEVPHQHFRAWTFVPVLAMISCLVLISQQTGEVWLRGAAIMVIGLVIYAALGLSKRYRGRR